MAMSQTLSLVVHHVKPCQYVYLATGRLQDEVIYSLYLYCPKPLSCAGSSKITASTINCLNNNILRDYLTCKSRQW